MVRIQTDLCTDTDVLAWTRAAVAERCGFGHGLPAARRVAPAAHLSRLGLTPPDYDALQDEIAKSWTVEVIIQSDARVQDVAAAIDASLSRRAA